MEGIVWQTEAFHIYPVGTEGPHRAECIHISILKNITPVTVEWKRTVVPEIVRSYFNNLGENLNVSGPT